MTIQERNSTDGTDRQLPDGRGLDSACTAKGTFKPAERGSSKLFFYQPCSVCFPNDGEDIPEDKTVVYRPSGNTYSFHRPESDDADIQVTENRDGGGRDINERIADEDFDIEDLELGGRDE